VDFVDRIDAESQKKGKTRQSVALAAGVTPHAIAMWKSRGSVPSAQVVVKIARHLETTTEFLVEATPLNDRQWADSHPDLIRTLARLEPSALEKVKDFAEFLSAPKKENPR